MDIRAIYKEVLKGFGPKEPHRAAAIVMSLAVLVTVVALRLDYVVMTRTGLIVILDGQEVSASDSDFVAVAFGAALFSLIAGAFWYVLAKHVVNAARHVSRGSGGARSGAGSSGEKWESDHVRE